MKPTLRFLIFLFCWLSGFYALAQPDRNGALDLSNSGDHYIWIADENDNYVSGGAFTVEMWINLQSNNDDDFTLFDFWNGGNRLSFVLKKDSHFRIEADGGRLEDVTWKLDNLSTSHTFLNEWKHIALSYDGSSLVEIFVDGSQVLQTNLLKNGTYIKDLGGLFPVDSGSNKWKIGGPSEEGVTGRAYIAEVRVWDTQVSDSNIGKYYDEAVNKSHPNYSDLLSYFPLNSDYYTDKPRFYDHTGNYNAWASDASSTKIRVRDFYPPVKPPSFENNFDLDFTANDCQTNDIDVDWHDLDTDGSYEPVGTNVYYELVREDNTSTNLSGNATSSYRDTKVSPGDKYRYRLRTYWEINGTKYYSDYSEWSDYGTIKEQYGAVSGFTSSRDNCDGSIDLSWSWSGDSPPKWTIQRAKNSSFSNNLTTVTSSLSGSSRSYTDNSASIETNYYYRIIASGTDANNCTVSGTYSSSAQGFSSEVAMAPTGLTVTVDDVNNELDISWINPANNNADSYILRREKEDGSDPVDFPISNLNTTTYSDSDIEICQTYRYKIAAVNECEPEGVFSNTTQTGLLGMDLSDIIASVDASKGYFANEVLIEWEINGSLSQVDRFRLERTVAGEDNYNLIAVIDNNLFFKDESATAGIFYNYRITGETSCNDAIVYTNEVVDLGFRQPFGIANGHVEYAGGNAVEDVTINFERQDGLQLGNSLKFDGEDDYVETDWSYNFSENNNELSVEFWMRTDGFSEGRNIVIGQKNAWYFQYLSDTDSFHFTVSGKDIANANQGEASEINLGDGEWHHIVGTVQAEGNRIYVDGVLSQFAADTDIPNSSDYRVCIGTVSSSTLSTFAGNLDEIRIWNYARSADEVANDYNRLLNGQEEGLVAYYRADEGIGNRIFDASKTGETFNKHDGVLYDGARFSDNIPDTDKLGIRAKTDEFGDYSVQYIPYDGSGDIFRVPNQN